MDSSVRPRPNYYETLGLRPDASDDEIAQAFTKKMSLSGMRPVGGAAQICAAYETLRNPAKRREHDRSLGLMPKVEARQWTVPSPKPRWEPFIAAPPTKPAEQLELVNELEIEPVAAPEPQVSPPEPRSAVEPRTASFIAEALRELAKPAVNDAPRSLEPREHRPPPVTPEINAEPDIRQILASRFAEEESARDVEPRRFNWKLPTVALGGLVVAAGLVGTVAGLSLRNEEGSAGTEPAVTVALPAPTEHSNIAVPPAARVIATPETLEQPPVTTSVPARPSPTPQPHKANGLAGKALEEAVAVDRAPALDSNPIEAASDEAGASQPAADNIAATLPLPSGVIARTIERIGYSCGEVTSMTAVAGTPGVFKVTCSSGSSYRAAPVRGRYHFRRW